MPWEVQDLHKESTKIRKGWIFSGMSFWNSCAHNGTGYGHGHLAEPVGQLKAWTLTCKSKRLLEEMVSALEVIDDDKHWSTMFKLLSFYWKMEWLLKECKTEYLNHLDLSDRSNLTVIVSAIPNSFLFLSDWLNFEHICISSVFSKWISTVWWVLKP